jgi:23S rRNA (cytosine1962-C5)-methyltransferase
MRELESLIARALQARAPLVASLAAEDTSCYRLFHGATEGLPGCTLDRYGDLLLWQNFREPPDGDAAALLDMLQSLAVDACDLEEERVRIMWHDRRRGAKANVAPASSLPPPPSLPHNTGKELGITYSLPCPARGKDPALFLDFRAARRWIKGHSRGKHVLNAFSYTCGASVAALAGGCQSVTSLDFSRTALDAGIANARLNFEDGLVRERFSTVCADALPAMRRYAGLKTMPDRRNQRGGGGGRSGRGRARGAPRGAAGRPTPQGPRIRAREFDLVVLDPPTWATTSFGAVDLVRDYQSLFKPSVLATKPGGTILATNHVSTVDLDEWLESLQRCAAKAGRPLSSLEVLTPEADFPSPDGRHPLKVALATVGTG